MPVGGNKPKKKLAIQNQSKIDREFSKKISYRHRPSVKVIVTKWISTVILGALLLACVTDSKISIIALSNKMNRDEEEVKEGVVEKQFVMLQLLAVIPNVINFIRGIWAGAFRQDLPWPRKKALIVGFFISLMESFGICMFVFNIPGITSAHNVILLMNCVFIVPLCSIIFTSFRNNSESKWKCLFSLALVFELIGIGLTGYLMKGIDPDKIWMVPVAILFLSISWTPGLLNFLLQTDIRSEYEEIVEENGEESYVIDTMGTGSSTPSASTSTGYQTVSQNGRSSMHESFRLIPRPPPNADERTSESEHERATWKLTIYMSFLKILFTFGISMMIFYVKPMSKVDMSKLNYKSGWNWSGTSSKEVYYFVANIATSVLGYMFGYIACTTCMQRWAFSVPLVLATPLSMVLLVVNKSCEGVLIRRENGGISDACPKLESSDMTLLLVAAGCLVLAQALSTGWLIFRSQSIVMLKEDQLFWVPMYNSALLEQWFMLMRRNEHNDECHEDPVKKAKRSKIIICTTMYREADYEMRQLLESIQGINLAQGDGGRHFESHVFFDGAVKDKNPTDFVLQLVSLVESTLGVKAETCSKTMTPYGMTLTWRLNADPGQTGMIFKIHLKDNFKVKNKKRWSQVMYMSYVLDFLMGQMDDATDDESYILTTDADVRFTPDSVEALLDLMTRDHSVGAVCARTHPLGSGPLLWYQVFEYAIGHWFQKAAEHVLGSVLCSPGCFSVYRCKAIRDILPQYASNVEHAFDFLTKDMGEDRWFCTLMVQSGWRIEYCAASENSTHCPEDFDEFFKQRRRWVASTIANLMLLVKEWHIIAKLNHRVSFVFLIYQAILLFATLIGPSSVILVVSGGLKYGWNWGANSSLVIQLIICVGFTMTCLMTSSKTQLNVAKLLTFLYAVIMTAVVVGTAVQIASDFNGDPSAKGNIISDKIKFSTTTLYIGVMAAIFLLAGMLHLSEFVYLLHGVWYLLCLPAGYLILMIYSICNITDRSWGTREVKTHSVLSQQRSWQDTLKSSFKSFFFCCFTKPAETKTIAIQTETVHKTRGSRTTSMSEGTDAGIHDGNVNLGEDINKSVNGEMYLSMIPEEKLGERSFRTSIYAKEDYDDEDTDLDNDTISDVKDWLPSDMKNLARNFIDNGFENTMLISGMTEKELKDIGIKRKGMKKYLLEEIKKLPDYEIQAEVPENLEEWLKTVGLEQYKNTFIKEQIRTSKDMEVLKSFGRSEIEKELKIKKTGHIKRLMYAIRKLRNPTESEMRIMEVKKALMVPKAHQLKTLNGEEYEFWDNLRNLCLMPQSTAFGLEDDLKAKLGDLRNAWLMIFAVSNTLWLILIYTLADKGQILSVFGSNPIGLVVLVLFGLVLIIQFLAMIVHRVSTLTHFLGRAPYRVGDTYNTTWAFNDRDMKVSEDDMVARRVRDYATGRAIGKLQQRRKDRGERRPLLQTQEEHV
ncbi:uncharacterized protein LOC123542969 isoform X2 [Mercenaria mercenaria]|nr:uncharacterized protein LOC123542969 isoform X2 [Mercenaria mercenaria]XP_045184961.2 uncharacterized protein LOC123542969 isoform X2 [Mercenaria mercenaria]